MRIVLFIICSFISSRAAAQIKTQVMAATAVPGNIRYQGKPAQVMQYQDQTGTYLAFTTQTGAKPQKGDDEFKQAHLYAYVYQLKGNAAPVLLWQLHDMVTECNLDMVAGFIPNALTVTDLDKNGKAEVWVAYRLSCRGDVSPSELKIIMHQGSTKYAMRGIGRLKTGNTIQHDGGVIYSSDFTSGPVAFRQYAGRLWDRYVMEVIK